VTGLLALLTWGAASGVVALLGWPLARLLKQDGASTFRSALWIGLLFGTLAILILGLCVPLGSGQAALGFGALLFIIAFLTWIQARQTRSSPSHAQQGSFAISPLRILALIAIYGSLIYLAIAVAGPVTNYDTGLYHFGAISYAHDYATIPGLANLFSPFGYSNSLFPLAAFLGNGPWNGEGFRLVNGLFITLLAVDVTLRILRLRLTVGTYVLLVCTGIALIPMVALSDFWVTSPSADPAVMILAFISLAYLSDAIYSKSALGLDSLVAVAAGVIAVSMRPLMSFFLISMIAVLLVLWLKTRRDQQAVQALSNKIASSWIVLLAITVAVGVVQGLRDYRLSGWLQYPLAFVSFDVPWRSANPTESQLSTLGYARDPANMHDVTDGWHWIPSWLARLSSQWESALIGALVISSFVVWLLLRDGSRHRQLTLALASAFPAALTIIIWFFFTPPSFRFAWGPIFGLFGVLIGWGLFGLEAPDVHRTSKTRIIPGVALTIGACAVLGVVGFSAVARLNLGESVENRTWSLGLIRIPYTVTPMLMPEVSTTTLESGLTIESPTPSDQCWGRYPLCSPQAPMSLRLQGGDIQSGFMAN
jgi:hypothetical protein